MPVPQRLRLDAIEIALAIPIGEDHFARPLPPTKLSPRAAFEAAVREQLRRPPCIVSFSGGRDSSAVLAIANHVARREGLDLPIPVTNRFPEAAETDETAWQEKVVGVLGLDDWIRLEWTDELDTLGPYAQRILRRHGILCPFNLQLTLPAAECARGGSLLTGFGGDELLGPHPRVRAARVVYERRRPARRHLRLTAEQLAPRPVRRALAARTSRVDATGWLTPRAHALARRRDAEESADHPLRWDDGVEWWWRRRTVQAVRASLMALAADYGATSADPFAHPLVMSAYARQGGAIGVGSRRVALTELVGDLLPADLLARRTKATFDAPLWSTHSREWVDSWNGEGVDPEIVSIRRLRDEWASPRPRAMTFNLAQRAWIASQEGRSAPFSDAPSIVGQPNQG